MSRFRRMVAICVYVRRSLTGYDNIDVNESTGRHADEEVYLYDAGETKLVCASCNPSGARPVGITEAKGEPFAPLVDDNFWGHVVCGECSRSRHMLVNSLFTSRAISLTVAGCSSTVTKRSCRRMSTARGMSMSMSRRGSAVARTGSATFSPRSGGCVGLISSGESTEESAFLDASENGDDVFFLTASQLAPSGFQQRLQRLRRSRVRRRRRAVRPLGCARRRRVRPKPRANRPPRLSPRFTPRLRARRSAAPATSLRPPPPAQAKVTKKKTVKCKKSFVKK